MVKKEVVSQLNKSLCILCALCVCGGKSGVRKIHPRDIENTEMAQRFICHQGITRKEIAIKGVRPGNIRFHLLRESPDGCFQLFEREVDGFRREPQGILPQVAALI